MIIAFTGGRIYNNYDTVKHIIQSLKITCVHVGDANGLDTIVWNYCTDNQIPIKVFKADWNTHGKAAGPIRNGELLKDADLLVAFPGGFGTENCVMQAKKMGISVLRVE